MYIVFDKQKMHVQIIVGTEEEYKPSDKVREIQQKVNTLKEKLELFQKNVIFPSIEEIERMVNEENSPFSSPEKP